MHRALEVFIQGPSALNMRQTEYVHYSYCVLDRHALDNKLNLGGGAFAKLNLLYTL